MHEKFRKIIKCTTPTAIAFEKDSDDDLPLISEESSMSKSNDDTLSYDDNNLYCDPEFPIDQALGTRKQNIEWQRPHEICKFWEYEPPKMYVDGGCQLDICQGGLGDCWFLAALATVSMHKELLHRVCPDQTFEREEGYNGKFNFKFYQYGKWIEVTIDDRLPTQFGQLIYTKSSAKNEFWSALIEKAYAKLNGSYQNLDGGLSSEAMVDLTGGSVEYIEKIREMEKDKLFKLVKTAVSEQGSLVTAAIQGKGETKRADGLISGHAYSVTKVARFRMSDDEEKSRIYTLIRLRNPWGQHEWNGEFCDTDSRWGDAGADGDYDKENDENGEFWMPFKDFARIFTKVEICRLSVEDFQSEGKWYTDDELKMDSTWDMETNTAGGCRNYDTFMSNTFMPIKLFGGKESDEVLISLQQKHKRKHKQNGVSFLTIGFLVFKIDKVGKKLSDMIDKYTNPVCHCGYFPRRDLCQKFQLPGDGNYIVVPTTFQPGQVGKFYLQCYVERPSYSHVDLD